MNIYTFHISTERVSPPSLVVHIKAHDENRAWAQIESEFPWKSIRLQAINDTPYVEETEAEGYCPPDPEERYWRNVQSWAERHSVTDEDLW